jgi:hypothetical protein
LEVAVVDTVLAPLPNLLVMFGAGELIRNGFLGEVGERSVIGTCLSIKGLGVLRAGKGLSRDERGESVKSNGEYIGLGLLSCSDGVARSSFTSRGSGEPSGRVA